MSLECPTCKKEVLPGRNHVFICSHAGMPDGVVFTPERSRYEWNCFTSDSISSKRPPMLNLEIAEGIKKFSTPIIFE